ncbi:hypothetical protein [Niabella ginsengisoli]|uniref:Uncharacterized protein n=1 Tax=Niabella ginsengisoli TaxID=522298 RepID=A0ABS9SQE7_9BACT|nr:hypothetical protein [Niabella ginsengisoli]MCH5600601.1 hypothetical protein [Niabella ginsengisoli]
MLHILSWAHKKLQIRNPKSEIEIPALFLRPMATETTRFQAIISHCKEYGFIFPSSEIYDGLQAVYDYGQWGAELKKISKIIGGNG